MCATRLERHVSRPSAELCLASAASLQGILRPVYKDDTPLRPPANMAGIHHQRELKIVGGPAPRPSSRGQDQPFTQFARNNAFVPRHPAKVTDKRLPAQTPQAVHKQPKDAGQEMAWRTFGSLIDCQVTDCTSKGLL